MVHTDNDKNQYIPDIVHELEEEKSKEKSKFIKVSDSKIEEMEKKRISKAAVFYFEASYAVRGKTSIPEPTFTDEELELI